MSEKEQIICDFTTGVCGPAGNEEQATPQGFVDLSTLTTDQKEQDQKEEEA